MNEVLQAFARSWLKESLARLGDQANNIFKRMYGDPGRTLSMTEVLDRHVDSVVDGMSEDKLDWAMEQVRRTFAHQDRPCRPPSVLPFGSMTREEVKRILGRQARLCTQDLPASYTEAGERLWKAFHLGEAFEGGILPVQVLAWLKEQVRLHAFWAEAGPGGVGSRSWGEGEEEANAVVLSWLRHVVEGQEVAKDEREAGGEAEEDGRSSQEEEAGKSSGAPEGAG